ncbi:ATP-binding cassette domain-containing protein [Salmonella enterica subsp. enterica]|uniref:ATP-binding cassette domain-containing protein n=2 Tax=Salmonella enterica TaxID=28901 RepID=A0A744KF65_SALER|nr:ATP-binding cassette domain-containing protein [Salmonella enterica subsp. enterica serovar Aqua]ECH1172483.1 ATP-binding cassette domain-containing protein [Salmonella enterica subsp. enterica serovar Aqua]HAF2609087.1 ATP-binding cassette domain-containing protein [Salmonella enterica]
MNKNDFNSDIEDAKSTLSRKERIRQVIEKKIKEVKGYTPRIGIFGSTGTGKSSLCNALFGREIAKVSHVAACTREIQEIHIESENSQGEGLVIIDFPGVGESIERKNEYFNLYKEKASGLDLVVWVIKSDERAYEVSQNIYKEILLPNIKNCPVIFCISQTDKIEPTEDENGVSFWHHDNGPVGSQKTSVELKEQEVCKAFDISPDRVIPVSVKKKYNISEIMERIVDILPKEKSTRYIGKQAKM